MNLLRESAIVSARAVAAACVLVPALVAQQPSGAPGSTVVRLVAEPASVNMRVNERVVLRVRGYDAAGNLVSDAPIRVTGPQRSVRWGADTLVAFAAGNYTLNASVASTSGSRATLAIPIRVLWPAVTRIEIGPPMTRVYTGTAVDRKAVARHADNTVRAQFETRWRSSDSTVASIDRFGVVTGLKPGTVTITAEGEGVRATERLTVVANPVRSLETRISETSIRTGDVIHLDATARRADGSAVPDVPIIWTYSYVRDDSLSGPPGGAGIIDYGRFVANYPGRFTLIAQTGNVVARKTISVTPRDVRRRISVMGRGRVTDVTTTDLWPWTGVDGRDYCLTGTFAKDGYAYVWDITDLNNVVKTDSIKLDARTVNDVMVSPGGRYAALAREGASNRVNGVAILDLSVPAHPKIASTFEQELTGGVHNLFATDDYLFAISGGQKYVIIDVRDIRNPKYVSEYRHPNAGIHDLWVHDGIAYSAQSGAGTVVVDVGNGRYGGSIEKPKLITVFPINSGHEIFPYFQKSTGKVYLFIGDEIMQRSGRVWEGTNYLSGFPQGIRNNLPQTAAGFTHIVDFTDPMNPRAVARYHIEDFGTHDIIVQDDILYQAYYEGGVRLVDVSGELLGNLYDQRREIAVFKPYDANGMVANAAFVTNAMPWKEHVLFTDANSGLWAMKLEPRPTVP